ncbi:MAG: TetR/AcrR family transcriptional regulator [Gemmatimonadota bacterium]|jgi:AcrR family transcriptional regulator
MTREHGKADRILDAAQRVLAVEGFSGTTISRVAEEADVSRGLLHYYFESKDDLLARMLRRSTEEAWQIMRGLMDQARSADELADSLVRAMRDYARTHEGSLSLLAEGLALARNHPRVQEEMTALHHEGQAVFMQAFEALKARGAAGVSIPVRGLATVVIALFDGLGLELQTITGLDEDEETWTAFGESLRRLLA